jgi:hypothetical protein
MCGAAFSFTERTDVQSQLSKRTSKSVSMNAQRAGSFGLVPIQVSKHGENELCREFSDSVRKWTAGLAHLAHQSIELGAGDI